MKSLNSDLRGAIITRQVFRCSKNDDYRLTQRCFALPCRSTHSC